MKLKWINEKRLVADLLPADYNPRVLTDKDRGDLEESIVKFDTVEPVVVNIGKRKNIIIGGHQRISIYADLGIEEIDVRVPSKELTIAEETELNIRLNKNVGDWDWKKLKNVELETLLDVGFGAEELSNMWDNEVKSKPEDDDVPEVPKEPKSKLGEIYQLGKHRIMCGDSTKVKDVEKLMDGKKADMVFTDPPYGVAYQSNMRTKTEKFDIIDNDKVFLDGWIEMVTMFSNGWVFIWTTWKVLEEWTAIVKPLGNMTNMVIWSKGGGGIGDLKKTFLTDYEIALVFNRGAELKGKRIGSVWKLKKDFAGEYKHPTQKPIELGTEAITKTTDNKAIVLDLFLGSGSTLIACEKTNRICYGMEISPQYIDVTIERWENFTGEKAKQI